MPKTHTARHTFRDALPSPHGRLETLSLVVGQANIATTHTLYGQWDMTDVLIDVARRRAGLSR